MIWSRQTGWQGGVDLGAEPVHAGFGAGDRYATGLCAECRMRAAAREAVWTQWRQTGVLQEEL